MIDTEDYSKITTDYYGVLGVTYDDPPEKIKARYRLLAFSKHSDIVGVERSSDLTPFTEAYRILSDPTRRQRYNAAIGITVQPRLLYPGTDLYQRIYVTSQAIESELTVKLTFTCYEPCSLCWLSGCHRCQGYGMKPERIELDVQLKSNMHNGMKIFIEGQGSRTEPSGPRGNLIVYVTIKEN